MFIPSCTKFGYLVSVTNISLKINPGADTWLNSRTIHDHIKSRKTYDCILPFAS